MKHHDLDPYPVPKDKMPLYINEPELIDLSIGEISKKKRNNLPENQPDNIRIYVPLDLNREAILRRLDWVIARYHEASEKNESDFSADVEKLIEQIEIYDQVWFVRHMPKSGEHSVEAQELVLAFIAKLEQIPDGCAELFPFSTIDELKHEYLLSCDA